MKTTTVGFKVPSADLHRKSPRIFFASLVCSVFATLAILIAPLPEEKVREKQVKPPPVFINLRNIPKTRQTVTRPAPARPRLNTATPVETFEILPDDITIEDTAVEVEKLPQVPVIEAITDTGAGEEENQIFEYYAVEEPPEPISSVVPEYPPMAERANIDGTVFMRLLVNTEGTVDSVIVEKGPKVFHSSAMNAAKKTVFKPAKQNDRPVACWVILPFRYILDKK